MNIFILGLSCCSAWKSYVFDCTMGNNKRLVNCCILGTHSQCLNMSITIKVLEIKEIILYLDSSGTSYLLSISCLSADTAAVSSSGSLPEALASFSNPSLSSYLNNVKTVSWGCSYFTFYTISLILWRNSDRPCVHLILKSNQSFIIYIL